MQPNEQELFLKDTEADVTKVDVLDAPLVPDTTVKVEGESEEGADGEGEPKDGEPKNRRERRLMAKLQAERESSMFLAGKLEARTEAGKAVTEESDYLKAVERIYGTDSPEAILATDLLKKAIVGAREDAKQAALTEMREERKREVEEERKATAELDGFVEEIEDEYNVTLTKPQQEAYFKLLERMSPKDSRGEVIEYADPHAVWEVFQEKLRKPSPDTTRAKDLSSRSMVKSGASVENRGTDDATARFLKEQGII